RNQPVVWKVIRHRRPSSLAIRLRMYRDNEAGKHTCIVAVLNRTLIVMPALEEQLCGSGFICRISGARQDRKQSGAPRSRPKSWVSPTSGRASTSSSQKGGPYPPSALFYDAVLTLTWAAAFTKRIGLGTSVLVLPMRHPLPLAKELATLQNLSEGRLILGAGVGWMEAEFAALGV